jgi:hypothetical protein
MSGIHRIRVERLCKSCGKTFLAAPREIRRGGARFCSQRCFHDARAIPLEAKFRRGVGATDATGCVLWAGTLDHRGYGILTSGTHGRGRRSFRAHRVAWELARGAIPEGLCILHACDNRACVNVDHLFLGTHLDNMADRSRKERQANRKLTAQTVRLIRARYRAGGVSQQQLADDHGVHQNTISRTIRGVSWMQVKD